jgi:hypothetical protein
LRKGGPLTVFASAAGKLIAVICAFLPDYTAHGKILGRACLPTKLTSGVARTGGRIEQLADAGARHPLLDGKLCR